MKITTAKEMNTTSRLEKKKQRITSNLQKLDETFKTHNVNFDESECVFDVVTKKVLNPKLAEEFLAHETNGKELLENFINERFEGEKSIWEPITKSKLPTFGSNVKTVTVKIKDQLVQVKEEHKLISRFLIVCRTRHDIDLPSYLGDYDFQLCPDHYSHQIDNSTNPPTSQLFLMKLRI